VVNGERQSWEPLEGESPAAHEAFRRYRDLGPRRTVRAAAGRDRGQHPPTHVKRWAVRWSWRERARAWDRHVSAIADTARAEQLAAEVATQRAEIDAVLAGVNVEVGGNGDGLDELLSADSEDDVASVLAAWAAQMAGDQ
jgi:hypothetical protein